MNVLMIHPEFPVSFWSYQEICKIKGVKALLPPLGLLTVAALLPGHWNIRLRDLNVCGLTENDWRWADMVMISGMLVQKDGVLQLTRDGKARGKTVAVGGPYATALPNEVLDAGCDFLFMGEVEESIPLFLSALEQRDSTGIFRTKQRPDLSVSPVPRFDLVTSTDYCLIAIQTSRGCPYDCEFCDIVSLYGRKPRYKTAEQVIHELQTLYDLGWRGQVFICDDNFIGNKAHARSILDRLIQWNKGKGQPFGFISQVSIDLGQNLELIDLMTAANFGEVFIGIESTDQETLANCNKKQNIKNPLMESLNNINKNGLSVMGSFILGFDGEEKGVDKRICDFVEKTNLPSVMVNILHALPNTRLWDRLESEGRLHSEKKGFEGFEVVQNFLPTRPQNEIVTEYLNVWNHLFDPSRYLKRCYRYILQMRPTRAALAAQRGEKPPPKSVPDAQVPWSMKIRDFKALIHILWRQGLLSPHRKQFWTQLADVRKKNPSRLKKYVISCGIGEHLFDFRKTLSNWVSVESASRVSEKMTPKGS